MSKVSIKSQLSLSGLSIKDTIYERPVFTSDALEKERRLVEIVHKQIASFAPRDVEKLRELINEACKNEGIQGFETTSVCVTFLSQRSFLFEKRATDRFYRNTGFAHREGLVAITRFVQENSCSKNGCRLDKLIKFINEHPERSRNEKKSSFKVYNPDNWMNQPWNDTYFFFYNKEPTSTEIKELLINYRKYFTINRRKDTYVGLQPLAFEIASLWADELLPPRPLEGYYDRSRIETYLIQMSSATETYGKGFIWAGKYTGRRAYFLNKNIDLPDINMSKHLPIGNPVIACAHISLGHVNDFKVVKVEPIRLEEDGCDQEVLKQQARTGIDLDLLNEETATVSAAVDSEDTLIQRSDLKEMISKEQSRIEFIDSILSNGTWSREEIMQKVTSKKDMFPRSFDAAEFILDRPYLYRFVDKKASVRPLQQRNVCTAFFEFLHDNGKQGMTLEQMELLLKTGVAGTELQKMVKTEKFQSFFSMNRQFLGRIYKGNPVTTHYSLLVTFDKKSKILLPFYGNCGPHLSIR